MLYRDFQPWEKPNNTREKISYFFTCVAIANQLLTRCSPLAPLGQVDEWNAKPSRFSLQIVCQNFLELRRLKYLKKPYDWQTVRFKLSKQGKKTNMQKEKTESYEFRGVNAGISLDWELNSTTGRSATGRLADRFLLSVRTKSKKVCKLKITTIVVFVIMIQNIFPS